MTKRKNIPSFHSSQIIAFCGIIFAITVSAFNPAYAQSYRLSGKALDAQDKSPLIGAHIRIADGEKTLSAVADKEGNFIFTGLRRATYQLQISYVGYESLNVDVVLNADKKLSDLLLKPRTEYLKEIEIVDKMPRVEQKGDTTIFNADAYKTAPDAAAEDLLKKMPGITTENGVVKAQGEDVKRVLVDGKRFFGDDPNMALRNLPAEIIERVQVFDQMSDQSQFTGFDDGQSVRTINIVTRNRVQNGQFGKVTTGYGYDDKYMAGGNLNLFKEDQRWSIIGQTNNINQQNFAMEDLMGMMGGSSGRFSGGRGGGFRPGGSGGGFSGRGGGGFMPGGGPGAFMVGSQSGTTTTNAIGLNYSGKVGEKIEVNGSYFFNQSDNLNSQFISRDYFLARLEDIRYLEDNVSENTNMNHRINLRIEYQMDSSNSLILSPRLSFQGYDSDRNLEAGQYQKDAVSENALLSDTLSRQNSMNNGYNFSNDLLFRHRFNKPGRTFSTNFRTSVNNRDGNQFMFFGSPSHHEDSDSANMERQKADILTRGYSLSGNVSYTEPLGRNSMLQASYDASYNENSSDKYTYDYIERLADYTDLDTLFSNVYQNDYLTQRVGLSYSIRKSELNVSFGVDQQWATLAGDKVFPKSSSLDKTFSSVLPNLMLNYRFKNRSNINLRYRTSVNSPSIDNLQDVIDNSNPTRLSTGNPELEQDYRHDLFVRYGRANAEKATSFFFMMGGSITDNYIARTTFIAPKDTMIADGILLKRLGEFTYPVNLDGSWNIRSFATYGMPVGFIKSNINLNASVNFNQIPGLIYDMGSPIMNYSRSLGLGSGLTLSSNVSEKVDFTLSTMANYNIERNTIVEKNNTNYYSQNSSARVNVIFLKSMVFRSDLTHQLYSGLSEGYDQSYFLWNVSLGRKLFKQQNGEIRLSLVDALNDNTSITHNITESYVEDISSNVINRYVLLSFTYNLRKFN